VEPFGRLLFLILILIFFHVLSSTFDYLLTFCIPSNFQTELALSSSTPCLNLYLLFAVESYTESHCKDKKQVIVHLFEWHWDWIARYTFVDKNFCAFCIRVPLKGQSHKKVGKMGAQGDSLGPN
jgi:hypothetical protein